MNPPCRFLKSMIISLVLQTLREVVVQAPSVALIIVGDETQNGGVVRELKDGVGAVCGYTVMHVQGVQEWTKCAALRGSSAQGQYRRGETAYSHHLWSAHQEVQDPVTRGGI